ncbi:MAG TPA: carboxypeptidase-like regulatory domain-containing protein, partial [Thermoanaerobaculia bacterium]
MARPRGVSVGIALLLGTAAAFAASLPPRIGHAARHGVSAKPIRDLKLPPRASAAPGARRILDAPAVPRPGSSASPRDARVQHHPGPSALDPFLNFDGAAMNDNLPFSGNEVIPPDANGAAGPDHYVQAINTVFRVFDKAGNLVLGPLPNASLWTGLGGVCETFDPNTPFVKYDTLANRWFVGQVTFDVDDASVHQCIAISTSGDPTGTYAQYDFVIDVASGSPPHPIANASRFGVWPEAYYMTVNQFGDSGNAGFGIYAFDRAAMLAGAPASFEYVNPGADHPQTAWGIPSDLDGATPPPDGSPNFALALGASFIDGSPGDVVHVWKFHADFANPGNATFSGPVDVPIADFDPLDCGNPNLGKGCVPQAGSSQLIQAEPSLLTYRLAYRNFGDHESLVTTFTVDGAAPANRAAVRWLELRDPNGSPTIYQQGTYAPDASYRFLGSIAMDRSGNIALGYSKSDDTIHPSLAVTGRLVGDPPGTLGEENAFFEGPESLPPVVGFWGHYGAMAVDPSDDCTFWFTSEYIGAPAPFFEYSRIGSFKFPSCTSGPSGTLQGAVVDATSGSIAGARVTAGASETLTDDFGHYQFLDLPAGTYDMTASKFGYTTQIVDGVVVNEDATTTQDFVLPAAPTAVLNGVVRDGSGGNWPLYARVRIAAPGFPGATLFTDPVTGYYYASLVTGISYTITVDAVTPGYASAQIVLPFDGAASLADTVGAASAANTGVQ